MRSYLLTLFSGLPLFTSWGVTPAGTDSPNIVVILADDLGSNELSCYGGENLITPHIDRIATEGMRFTNNYASCAMVYHFGHHCIPVSIRPITVRFKTIKHPTQT